ncbi:Pleckstriny domain-containing family A mem ber 8 [Beauveria bassiana D1-5]|uniref:Pleckstriny domain-containing family A mem ber 8 n=1 Tax=Beauveria bassiana D1-5 TaxID=1245745 RepID=A0A0A2W8M6_BEABA|nr:Pleckstriny domain-containing family A mem ber 8 [Beauveria bassiana D1-5]
MSAPVIPPGGTIVQTFKRSFVDVPIDEANGRAVGTSEFLEAAESLTTIFGALTTPPFGVDALGSVAFSPVKNDMIGNIKKIRDRQLASPVEGANIQDLCRNELKTKKHTATEGLLWLVRGLEFTCLALTANTAKPDEELADSFRAAYASTLKPHHSFLVKPIFSAAMSACPYRKDFYAKLGDDGAKVTADLQVYLTALAKIVGILKQFLDSKEAKW